MLKARASRPRKANAVTEKSNLGRRGRAVRWAHLHPGLPHHGWRPRPVLGGPSKEPTHQPQQKQNRAQQGPVAGQAGRSFLPP